jgi:hypothetical protein
MAHPGAFSTHTTDIRYHLIDHSIDRSIDLLGVMLKL